MKTSIIILALALSVLPLYGGEPPDMEWDATFGGAKVEQGESVIQTSDGGFAVTSYSASFSDRWKTWLIKTDSEGNELWNRTYGVEEYGDRGYALIQTFDKGFAISGYRGTDLLLLRIDPTGNELWSSIYGEVGKNEYGYSLVQTFDGGFTVVGVSSDHIDSQILLIRTDADGNELWEKHHGTNDKSDWGYSLIQTDDEGFVITGIQGAPHGTVYLHLIKTDSDGDEIWSRTFGDVYTENHGYSIVKTFDGGFAIAGKTTRFSSEELLLLKTDSDGYFEWEAVIGGNKNDSGHELVQTADGGYAIVGHTESYGSGMEDVWLVKTDSDGNELWDMTFGTSGADYGNSLVQATDGGFVLTGSISLASYDVWLIKTTTDPKLLFSLQSPASGDTFDATPILFDWEETSIADTTTYTLYIDPDSSFSDPIVVDGIAESEYVFEDELENFERFYWKVKAVGGGVEIWSREVFCFHTYYPEAVVGVEPDSLVISVPRSEIGVDSLFISNSGNIDLEYSIEWSQGWLDVFPTVGSVHPGGEEGVLVCCVSEFLEIGTYFDTLWVVTNAEDEPVRSVPVTLIVESPVKTILECDDPVAPRGGHLEYRAGLANETGESWAVDAWIDLYLLSGNPYPGNPYLGPISVSMGPFFEVVQERDEYIPNYAPLGGPYEICLRCGPYPEIWNETCLEFSVTPPPLLDN